MFTAQEVEWLLVALTVMLDRAVTRGTASEEKQKEILQLIRKVELLRGKCQDE